MKTADGTEIKLSKKDALILDAMECGFQRFEAEAFYHCLRRFKEHVAVEVEAKVRAQYEQAV